MSHGNSLLKEKIVSLSELQRNPSRALNADIVRIVRSGKELGIFMKRAEFEDLLEEQLPLKTAFRSELDSAIKKSKVKKRMMKKKLFLS